MDWQAPSRRPNCQLSWPDKPGLLPGSPCVHFPADRPPRLLHVDERDRAAGHVRQLAVPFFDREALVLHLAQTDQFGHHLLALDGERLGLGTRLGHALTGFDLDAQQVAANKV
jgi:hypothetical protein